MNFGVLTYVLLVTSSPVAPGTTVGKTCFGNPKCDEHHFCSHFHCTQTVFSTNSCLIDIISTILKLFHA